MSEKLPNFNKLSKDSNYYSWEVEIKTYFESTGLWGHVLDNEEIEVDEEDPETEEMKAAKCRRILLHSIEQTLHPTIQNLQTASEMFSRIKRLFVGTPAARVRAIREKLGRLTFEGCYFTYLNEFSNLVFQLEAEDEVLSYKALTYDFLKRLPKMLSATTQPLMRSTQQAEEDVIAVWNETYELILEYCIDTELYKIKPQNNREQQKKRAVAAKDVKKKKHPAKKCWSCGESGHFKRNCPKRKENKSTEDNERSWGASSVQNLNSEKKELNNYLILDSGASNHSCGDKQLLEEIVQLKDKKEIQTANGTIVAKDQGKMRIILDNGDKFLLSSVIYWKGAPNLLSIGRLIEFGFNVVFNKKGAKILTSDGTLVYQATKDSEGVYKIYFKQQSKHCLKTVEKHQVDDKIWHARLNHCSKRRLEEILGRKTSLPDLCDSCERGKSRRKPIKNKTKGKTKDVGVLQLLHADCIGPVKESVDRKLGLLVICDTRSHFLWGKPFRRKSEVPDLMLEVLNEVERSFPGVLQFLRTDNGTEFVNSRLSNYLRSRGIRHQTTQPYVHEDNGRIENWNRIIMSNVRAALLCAKLSSGFWTYAAKAVIHVHNMMPLRGQGMSPWETVYGRKTNLKNLIVFGAPGYAHVERESRKKLETTSVRAIMLGYSPFRDGHVVMNLENRKIYFTRSFKPDEKSLFDEGDKSHNDNIDLEPENSLIEEFEIVEETGMNDDHNNNTTIPESGQSSQKIPSLDSDNILLNSPDKDNSIIEDNSVESLEKEANDDGKLNDDEKLNDDQIIDNERLITLPISNEERRYNLRPYVRVPKHLEGTMKPLRTIDQAMMIFEKLNKLVHMNNRQWMLAGTTHNKGFHSYREAVAQNPIWKDAYAKELRKLEERGGLKVIKRTDDMDLLPFLEVLTKKEDNISGKIKYKVRLAIRGDLQNPKPTDTYSPTIDPTSAKLAIIGYRSDDAFVRQGDCPGAYLNGRLDNNIYLSLPQGHDQKTPNDEYVYSCPASIYGLAISGKVWYMKFKREVERFGLIPSIRHPCMFVCEKYVWKS